MTSQRSRSVRANGSHRTLPHLGQKVTRNISVPLGVIQEVDRIAACAKAKTGLQMDRSKLLALLSELVVEAERHLTLEHIYTPQNFKAAVAQAIGVHAKTLHGLGRPRKN